MKKIISIITLLFCLSTLCAQKIARPDSYNYTRGVEAFQNNNIEEALYEIPCAAMNGV